MLSSDHKFENGQIFQWGMPCMIVGIFDGHAYPFSTSVFVKPKCLRFLFMPKSGKPMFQSYELSYVVGIPNLYVASL